MKATNLNFVYFGDLIRCDETTKDHLIDLFSDFLSNSSFVYSYKHNLPACVLWVDWMDETQWIPLFNELKISY